jgi:hypothetical protein
MSTEGAALEASKMAGTVPVRNALCAKRSASVLDLTCEHHFTTPLLGSHPRTSHTPSTHCTDVPAPPTFRKSPWVVCVAQLTTTDDEQYGGEMLSIPRARCVTRGSTGGARSGAAGARGQGDDNLKPFHLAAAGDEGAWRPGRGADHREIVWI